MSLKSLISETFSQGFSLPKETSILVSLCPVKSTVTGLIPELIKSQMCWLQWIQFYGCGKLDSLPKCPIVTELVNTYSIIGQTVKMLRVPRILLCSNLLAAIYEGRQLSSAGLDWEALAVTVMLESSLNHTDSRYSLQMYLDFVISLGGWNDNRWAWARACQKFNGWKPTK